MQERAARSIIKSRPWRPFVVIPALNEVGSIEQTLGTVMTAVDAYTPMAAPVNVYVVDNGSKDGTPDAVRDLTHNRPNFHLVTELRSGPGHARRRGVREALRHARMTSPQAESWIINTDADVEVPPQWLNEWAQVFRSDNPGIVVGNVKPPASFAETYPNAFLIMQTVAGKVALAEEIFGITNTHGTHSAISSDSYRRIGPFQQPVRITPEGKEVNTVGEDWDMGTRARALGMTISRSPMEAVTASQRRFYSEPSRFVDGTGVNAELRRVNDTSLPQDLDMSKFEELVATMTHTRTRFYVSKPLLADPSLIDRPEVQVFLGEELTREIKGWIDQHNTPTIFQDRNGFHSQVDLFHEEFGWSLTNLLLQHEK